MNIHKTFSDIEADIQQYYAAQATDKSEWDALDAALKIAGRALAVAAHLHGGRSVSEARQLIYDVLLDRQK